MANRIAFVLASTEHGTMIVNRLDYCIAYSPDRTQSVQFGVGHELLEASSYELNDVGVMRHLLDHRRASYGDGVVAMDCGANIGTHTVSLARHMTNWGRVIAIEPQTPLFYALCGNIALNNCHNAEAYNEAVGDVLGEIEVPSLNYQVPGSYGSLELVEGEGDNEFIGQVVDYRNSYTVPAKTIDSYKLERLDLVKIDVEGMELEVLRGAVGTLHRFFPIILVERIKVDEDNLTEFLAGMGYKLFPFARTLVAVHTNDPALLHVKQNGAA